MPASTISVVAPSLRRIAAAGPSDLKPLIDGDRIRLLDEMRAVVEGDDGVELRLPHAGEDVGEALLKVHLTHPSQDEGERRGAYTSSVPAASPRSVSSNNSSSGRCFEIIPCWCT